MANAFNTVDRGEVLRVVHSTCPELFPYVEWLYASESRLLFQGHVINSSQGVQQPLSLCSNPLSVQPFFPF